MSLRPPELRLVCEELNARLRGANVQKAFTPLPRLSYLEVRQPGRTLTICVSAEPELARISVTKSRLPNPGEPQPFQRALRSELTGLAFVDAQLRERAVRLRFRREDLERHLWLDLNASGLLVLTSPDERVLAVSGEGGKRGVYPGATYSAPAASPSSASPTAAAPSSASPSSASPTAASPTAAAPTAASPTAASPTAASPTAAAPTAASPTAASPTAASPTAASPTAASPTAASPTAASPSSADLSRLEIDPAADFPIAEASERLHAGVERVRRAEAIRRRLAQPYRARLGRLGRTLAKVREEASRAPLAEEHRRLGELLSQNLHRIPRGAKKVTLSEYAESGVNEVEVTLDPKRSPKDEVTWHFHQYKRLLRGCEHARHRLLELEREASTAEQALRQIEAMSDDALLAQLEILASPAAAAQPQQAMPYREYATASGQRIWVGKHSEGNDTLTFKVARPHHLWLHARGVPGSHVVVPIDKSGTLPQEALLDAAHLALFHSDLKGEPRGEVSYVPIKYVRRIKDGAPGQVTFTQEKTFVVRLEPDRLKRLLASEPGR